MTDQDEIADTLLTWGEPRESPALLDAVRDRIRLLEDAWLENGRHYDATHGSGLAVQASNDAYRACRGGSKRFGGGRHREESHPQACVRITRERLGLSRTGRDPCKYTGEG